MTCIGIRHNLYDGPIGGGDGYGDIVVEGDASQVVSTWSSLKSAAENASQGEVIFVDSTATLDAGSSININPGVTIASSRGDTSVGSHAYIDASSFVVGDDPNGLFKASSDVRITGLEVDQGNRSLVNHEDNYSSCVEVQESNVTVDNCKIRGFVHAGIYATNHRGLLVKSCDIREIWGTGLAYGVSLYGETPADNAAVVEYCAFEEARHAVSAANCDNGCVSYETRDSIFFEHRSSVLDVHGTPYLGEDAGVVDEERAGNWFYVHHNKIEDSDMTSFMLRAIPNVEAVVEHNWSYNDNGQECLGYQEWSDATWLQNHVTSCQRFTVNDNHLGTSKPNNHCQGQTAPEEEEEQYQTTFGAASPGSTPDNWTLQWDSASDNWNIVEDTSVQGDRLLEYSASDQQRRAISWDAVGSASDSEILTKLRVPSISTNGNHARLFLRGGVSASGNPTGYLLDVREQSFTLASYLSDGSYDIVSETGTPSANTWYWVRLRATGDNIQARFWQDGNSEPSTWNIDVNRPDHDNGWVGLGGIMGGPTHEFDAVGVGVGGATAPTPTDPVAFRGTEFEQTVDPVADWGIDDTGASDVAATINSNIQSGDLVLFPDGDYLLEEPIHVVEDGESIGFAADAAFGTPAPDPMDSDDTYGYTHNVNFLLGANANEYMNLVGSTSYIVEGITGDLVNGDDTTGPFAFNNSARAEARNINESGRAANGSDPFIRFSPQDSDSVHIAHLCEQTTGGDVTDTDSARHGLLVPYGSNDSANVHVVGCDFREFGHSGVYISNELINAEVDGCHIENCSVALTRLGAGHTVENSTLIINGSNYSGPTGASASTDNHIARAHYCHVHNTDDQSHSLYPNSFVNNTYTIRDPVSDLYQNGDGLTAVVEYGDAGGSLDIQGCSFDIDVTNDDVSLLLGPVDDYTPRGFRIDDCSVIGGDLGDAPLIEWNDGSSSDSSWTPDCLIRNSCVEVQNGNSDGLVVAEQNGAYTVEVTDSTFNVPVDDYVTTGDVTVTFDNVDTSALCTDTNVGVQTDAASSITSSSAVLVGNLHEMGGNTDVDVWFQYRQTGDSSWNSTARQTVTDTGNFQETLDSLTPGTDYEFRAAAEGV